MGGKTEDGRWEARQRLRSNTKKREIGGTNVKTEAVHICKARKMRLQAMQLVIIKMPHLTLDKLQWEAQGRAR